MPYTIVATWYVTRSKPHMVVPALFKQLVGIAKRYVCLRNNISGSCTMIIVNHEFNSQDCIMQSKKFAYCRSFPFLFGNYLRNKNQKNWQGMKS